MADLTITNVVQNPETNARFTSFMMDREKKTAVVAVEIDKQDGSHSVTRYITVQDGPLPADKWLTGRGISGEPIGLLRGVLEDPGGEAGVTPQARFARRTLTWVKNNTSNIDDMTVL